MITSWLNLDFSSFFPNRGISSTVRRCICKETGREFAAKIIDLGAESGDVSSSQMLEATRQEIAILRQVMGHPYISKCAAKRAKFYRSTKFVFLCFFSWIARCIWIRCLHFPCVWIVPEWWTVRLFDVSCYTFRKENSIHYEVNYWKDSILLRVWIRFLAILT